MSWPNWDELAPEVNDLGKLRTLRPLRGSWSTGKVMLLRGSKGAVVIKRWFGPEEHDRCRAELAVLRELAASQRVVAPRPVAIGGSTEPWSAGSGSLLTAQEFIPGLRLSMRALRSAVRPAELGRLIATMQDSAVLSRPCSNSRLAELRELPHLSMPAECVRDVLLSAWESVMSRIDEVLGLPHGQVHGDINFENILRSRDGLKLVDFEFSRVDARVLDFAGLRAPTRTRAGHLILVPPTIQSEAVLGFSRESRLPLSKQELRLIPDASLMHFLLVAHDQLAAGGSKIALVLPVITALSTELSKR
jgi:Ser/Thr protein kinase RdoA (MazF antagonist)